jgi:aryl-alcohol dehydrogenase-like predicted oxidoreductase
MAIEHKRLGKHGVLVSNICLGTMNFGWHTAQEESFKIMDRALELGINFFDTADVYVEVANRATPRKYWAAGLPREAGDEMR